MSNVPRKSAREIVQLLGGTTAVAARLKISRTQVWRWGEPRHPPHLGCGDEIPAKHHREILEMAREQGKDLSPSDLMPWLEGAA